VEGEQEAIAEVEAETPIETEAPEQPVDLEAAGEQPEEAAAEQPPEPDEDFEDFDWNGKQIRAPKGLKDSVLMHADYTQKTQAVAAQRKELEAREQAVIQQAKAHEEEVELHAKLYNFKTQIEPYAKLTQADWDAWEQDDPLAAQSGWRRFQQLQNEAQKTYWEVNNRQQERATQEQQATAKRLEETRKFAETIPGWSAEVDAKITEFAVKEGGFDVDTLKAAYNPQIYRMLHLAWLGHQTMQKASAPAAKAPPPAPLQVVAAKAAPPARKDPGSMSMDEYAAWRNRQEAAKRAASGR
jgi:hypothetical protein